MGPLLLSHYYFGLFPNLMDPITYWFSIPEPQVQNGISDKLFMRFKMCLVTSINPDMSVIDVQNAYLNCTKEVFG